MQKYHNISFSASTCLSSETMHNYLSNSLSKEEKRRVEMHLADCEMCSDELEGLSLLENPQKLNVRIEELDSKIDNHSKNKKNLFIQKIKPYYSIAALILVLIAISVFLIFQEFSSEEVQMAENIAKEELNLSNEPTIVEKNLAQKKSISNDTISKSLKINQKQISQNLDLNLNKNKKSSNKRIDKDRITKNQAFDKYALDSETLVSSSNNAFVTVDSTIRNENSAENTKGLKLEEEKEDEVIISEEMNDTEMEYSAISAEKKRMIKSKNTSAKSTLGRVIYTDSLELALKKFEDKSFQKTIDLLEKLNFDKNTKNFAKAKWFLALSYLELNETDKANRIFLELSEFKNSYQKKAKRKLKD